MDLKDIIIKPIITEKALQLIEEENKYCFKVARNANRHQIREAIEKFFKVKVEKVNVANFRGKKRRILGRRRETKLGDWKKAIVKLAEGEKIDIFPETAEKEPREKKWKIKDY